MFWDLFKFGLDVKFGFSCGELSKWKNLGGLVDGFALGTNWSSWCGMRLKPQVLGASGGRWEYVSRGVCQDLDFREHGKTPGGRDGEGGRELGNADMSWLSSDSPTWLDTEWVLRNNPLLE